VAEATSKAAPQGRVSGSRPVAVIDIGSNSVRLVVYEHLSRSPTVLFNEKVLCGLGRGLATTNRLADDAVERAVASLARFRMLADQCGAERVEVIATAAAREAENGPEFIARAATVCRTGIRILSGAEEAHFSALGVVSSVHRPHGLVGDLGGGSLELVQVHGTRVGQGVTLPLGGLRLQDTSGNSLKKAEKIVAKAFDECEILDRGNRRDFYAIGGTWRSLARLHMHETGYPLRVMHEYEIAPDEALEFCRAVARRAPDAVSPNEIVSKARQPLLPYGAVVLGQLIERARPSRIVMSALGVREGYLYDLLDTRTKKRDPLIAACEELAVLRARSPAHAAELVEWTRELFAAIGIDETADERRLRAAACLLADTGWRAHPDYRGEQSVNILANAAFIGIDHPGRSYLALAVFFRHVGLVDDAVSPRLRELVSTRLMERSRLLGAALRVAYLISAAMPGTIPQTHLAESGGRLVLTLPPTLAALDGERLRKRLAQLGKLVGLDSAIEIAM